MGETDELGGWDVSRCVSMNWNEGDFWVAETELPSGCVPPPQPHTARRRDAAARPAHTHWGRTPMTHL